MPHLVLAIAKHSDQMNHHADFELYQYNKLKISLTTHDKNKVTELDWELAEYIDRLLKEK